MENTLVSRVSLLERELNVRDCRKELENRFTGEQKGDGKIQEMILKKCYITMKVKVEREI